MAEMVQNKWLWIASEDLDTELRQLRDEGLNTGQAERMIEKLQAMGNEKLFLPENQTEVCKVLDFTRQLAHAKGYEYDEPDELKAIRKLRPDGPRRFQAPLSERKLADHIGGAWLGRCIGCLLGKPIEGVKTPELWGFLQATGQWPLNDYIRFASKAKAAQEYPGMLERKWFDSLDHMPVDDDTNYTLTGLLIVQQKGPDFTPADVGQFWMDNLPLLSTCTAERVAYRNLSLHIQPPESGRRYNPYREWIGAQIRADAFGYLAAGNPQRAAEWAWRDASISHVKNGMYGEMFIAAAIAASSFVETIVDVIEAGLSEIPQTSRLYRSIVQVLQWYAEDMSYDQAVEQIHQIWDETNQHDWCHTISNAVICATGLLWGEDDFGLSICRAVQPGFDTDCNGATVGSIMGMRHGKGGIDEKWSARLNDTLKTSLRNYDTVRISDISRQTTQLYKQID
ncbi:MAG: ADP-ribosylglycohydrolase family protein [Phycisphaerae bacterium]